MVIDTTNKLHQSTLNQAAINQRRTKGDQMTTLQSILRAAGCKVSTDCAGNGRAWVLMTNAARAVLVAAGQRNALDIENGVWCEVAS